MTVVVDELVEHKAKDQYEADIEDQILAKFRGDELSSFKRIDQQIRDEP